MTNEQVRSKIVEVSEECLDRISLIKGKWMPHQRSGDSYKDLIKLEGLIEATMQMAKRGQLPEDRYQITLEELTHNLPILQNQIDEMF